MPNFAQVNIIGHVGKAETFKYGDKEGVKFSVAYSDWRKGKDGNKKPSVWFDVTLFNASDITRLGLAKGVPVFVTARPEMQVWTKDGQENQKLVWIAETVEILKRSDLPAPASAPSAKPVSAAPNYAEDLDDDLPF